MDNSDLIDEIDISGTTDAASHRPLEPLLIADEDENGAFIASVEEVFDDDTNSETSLNTMEILFPEPGCDFLDSDPPLTHLRCRCSLEFDQDSESTGSKKTDIFNLRPSDDNTPPVKRTSKTEIPSKNAQQTSRSSQSKDGSRTDHADYNCSWYKQL